MNRIYYIKVSGSLTRINLSFLTKEKMLTFEGEDSVKLSLFFGIVLAMLLYNSFIFFSTKSLSYFYYVFYILFYGLFHGGFFLGNALAGPVKVTLGLKYNFAFGLLFSVIAAAYTLIFIKETLVKEKKIDVPVSNDGTNIMIS